MPTPHDLGQWPDLRGTHIIHVASTFEGMGKRPIDVLSMIADYLNWPHANNGRIHTTAQKLQEYGLFRNLRGELIGETLARMLTIKNADQQFYEFCIFFGDAKKTKMLKAYELTRKEISQAAAIV